MVQHYCHGATIFTHLIAVVWEGADIPYLRGMVALKRVLTAMVDPWH